MASWIVHLRIADKLLAHLPELDAGQFSIGNVAPDSGVPDKKRETFTPPPELAHFKPEGSPPESTVLEDLRFYRQYMQGVVSLPKDPKRFSFLLGYFFHLITDNLWAERIVRPTREQYESEFENHPGFIWEVKKDWYGLDFTYVRTHPDCLFWRIFVDSVYEKEYLVFFPKGAISDKLAYIKSFYQRMDDEVEDKLRLKNHTYLNEAEMALFVDGAYRDLLKIYQIIWGRSANLDGMSSAIELLS